MADIPACRNQIAVLWKDPENRLKMAAHAGLLLSRYLQGQDEKNEAKRSLLAVARDSALGAASIYKPAYRRWTSTLGLSQVPCATHVFSVRGRLVIGLGGDSVLETGLTLHHTYGTPVIPGSALKGLAAHYCDQVWGRESSEFKKTVQEKNDEVKKRERPGNYFREIFGTQEDSGHITFHDAWITPESLEKGALRFDVMTPHHRKYYTASEKDNDFPPSDFDDPNPVVFLSITGDFLLALSCDVYGDQGRQWVDLSLELLRRALNEWGIGGKTASGYGRMQEKGSDSGESRAGLQEDSDKPESPRKPTRKYRGGEKVLVTRVKDARKNKRCFQADDGLTGVVSSGEVPDIEIGKQTELWIAIASDSGYSFTSVEPVRKKKGKK